MNYYHLVRMCIIIHHIKIYNGGGVTSNALLDSIIIIIGHIESYQNKGNFELKMNYGISDNRGISCTR